MVFLEALACPAVLPLLPLPHTLHFCPYMLDSFLFQILRDHPHLSAHCLEYYFPNSPAAHSAQPVFWKQVVRTMKDPFPTHPILRVELTAGPCPLTRKSHILSGISPFQGALSILLQTSAQLSQSFLMFAFNNCLQLTSNILYFYHENAGTPGQNSICGIWAPQENVILFQDLLSHRLSSSKVWRPYRIHDTIVIEKKFYSGIIDMVELPQYTWLGCHFARTRKGLFISILCEAAIGLWHAVALTISDASKTVKLFARVWLAYGCLCLSRKESSLPSSHPM